jgi:signal transduction histidine kinase
VEDDPLTLHKSRLLILLGAVSGAVLLGLAIFLLLSSSTRGLPYHDSFAKNSAGEWQQLGGVWSLSDGKIVNSSDQRGAKLLTGSRDWSNYSVEADIQLDGNDGDAGLVIRVGNEDIGSDSYSGYYAGIRSRDGTLVLGRADHGWMERQPVPFPTKVDITHWFHLRLIAFDCLIGAIAQDEQSHAQVATLMRDSDCVRRGKIALRSYGTTARWKNVTAKTSSQSDIIALHTVEQSDGMNVASLDLGYLGNQLIPSQNTDLANPTTPLVSIDSLRYRDPWTSNSVRVRGTVVMNSSSLLMQDATAGISVQLSKPGTFNVGDEIEAEGKLKQGDFDVQLENASARLLWPGKPIPPKSLPASEIATGAYDAQYVEVTGTVTHKQIDKGDEGMQLDLSSGSQSFSALLFPQHDLTSLPNLRRRSVVRLRGVASVSPAYTHGKVPFVILISSVDGIELLAGPPWWSVENLVWIIPICVIFILLAQMLRVHVKHVRVRAVMSERERLAHEMHDTLAQSFAGIGYQLQAIRNGVESGSSTIQEQLSLASDLVRHSHQEARRSIESLHPELMRSSQLATALEHSARSMVRRAPLEICARTEGQVRALPPRVLDALFRIGQEAIANAIRHANPTRIEICVEYQSHSIRLSVIDDGTGFIPNDGAPGFGLRGMRKRVEDIAGKIDIASAPAQGCNVSATAPLGPSLTVGSWVSAKLRQVR